MSADLNQLLPFILIGFVVAVLVIWLIARANRKTTIVGDETSGDVLDEGAAPAARNQALIDAPTAMEENFGQTTANANSDKVAAAPANADAEAGASVAPTGVETATTPVPDAPEPEPLAAPIAAQKAPAPAASEGDDLRQIKGLGPKLATMLNEQGITRFAQIAAWTDEDVARVDATLGKFSGRITRDQWVEQAKLLEKGDKSGFSDKFGNNT